MKKFRKIKNEEKKNPANSFIKMVRESSEKREAAPKKIHISLSFQFSQLLKPLILIRELFTRELFLFPIKDQIFLLLHQHHHHHHRHV